RYHGFRRRGIALGPAGAGDVDADDFAVQANQGPAAIARPQYCIVVQNRGEAVAAVAEYAAHTVLKIAATATTTAAAARLPVELRLQLHLLVAALHANV